MATAADVCLKDVDEVEPVVCPVLAAVPALRSKFTYLVKHGLNPGDKLGHFRGRFC
jgi:hypothetical protein